MKLEVIDLKEQCPHCEDNLSAYRYQVNVETRELFFWYAECGFCPYVPEEYIFNDDQIEEKEIKK